MSFNCSKLEKCHCVSPWNFSQNPNKMAFSDANYWCYGWSIDGYKGQGKSSAVGSRCVLRYAFIHRPSSGTSSPPLSTRASLQGLYRDKASATHQLPRPKCHKTQRHSKEVRATKALFVVGLVIFMRCRAGKALSHGGIIVLVCLILSVLLQAYLFCQQWQRDIVHRKLY